MTTALTLIFLGVLTRLVPHPPNFVPMAAIALYAGARLPKRFAWAIPLLAMALSDIVIDGGFGSFGFAGRWVSYATFALVVGLGRGLLRGENVAMPTRFGMSLVGSTLFFLTTNFAVWAEQGGYSYPLTWNGLVTTYAVAIPFFGNSVAADLIGVGALFSLDAIVSRAVAARREQVGAAS